MKMIRLSSYVFVSGLIVMVFILVSGININSKASFSGMIYGYAHKPFVYRQLLPLSIRLGQVMSSSVRPGSVSVVLIYLSLLGFTLTMDHLTKDPRVVISSTIGLVYLFIGGYIYDLPTLFLFVFALAIMRAKKWYVYLLTFALASLNKETSILLLLPFITYFRTRIPITDFSLLFLAQVVSYGFIQSVLRWGFRNNPGVGAEFHLWSNVDVYSKPVNMAILSLFLIGMIWAIFYQWKEKPMFFRHAILMAPPLVVLHIVFGWAFEWRVFYELYPILVVLLSSVSIRHTVFSLVMPLLAAFLFIVFKVGFTYKLLIEWPQVSFFSCIILFPLVTFFCLRNNG